MARAVALWLSADPGGRAGEQLESLLGAVRLHPAQLLHQVGWGWAPWLLVAGMRWQVAGSRERCSVWGLLLL